MRPRTPVHPYLALAPTFLLLGLFFFYPLGSLIVQSFYSWDLLTPASFAGLDNYRAINRDGLAWAILGRTAGFSVLVVGGSLALGLGLAVALDRPGRTAALVRGTVFSAYVVSWVAVALLWTLLLDGDAGVVGSALRHWGVTKGGPLADPSAALIALAAVTVWKITGYAMVMFLAGLQDTPRSLLEAAALDGAGPWRRFWEITWPLLRPTATFVATTSLILSFQAFDVVRVMTQGGPVRSTTIFVYAIYEEIFLNLRVGRASALGIVFFGCLLALTGLQLWAFRANRRSNHGTTDVRAENQPRGGA